MPKPELGTKRVCPETGRKFYDLNRDPIVSPYTGQSYPLTFFEGGEPEPAAEKEEVVESDEKETEGAEVEIVSLEEADDEASDTGETIPDMDGDDDDDVDIGDDNDDVDIGDDNDDTFLETDDDEDNDVSDIITVSDDDEET